MAGVQFPGSTTEQRRDTLGRPVNMKKPGTYPGSILQGAEDYDEIMSRYRDIARGGGAGNELNALMNQYKKPYQRGPELTGAFSNMRELSRTGGLNDAQASDLRARGVSPIRAIYANAQQNLNRQRRLQGGYSPGYNAASIKMARELSEQIGQQVTNVNAGIAEAQQRGRLSAAPQYTQFAQNETNTINDLNNRNNASLTDFYARQNQNKLQAAEGMRSLYGTTPANANLYGNQAIQQAQLQLRQPRRSARGGVQIGAGRFG